MIDFSQGKFHLVDGNFVLLCTDAVLRVEETSPGGEAVVKFDNPGAVILIKNFKERAPIEWLKNKSCADGVLITATNDEVIAHIVELKSKLTFKNWRKAKEQFEGAALNARAVLKILNIAQFDQVVCYISFLTEEISAKNAVNLVHLKTLVGQHAPLGDGGAWMEEKLGFCEIANIPVKKIPRDENTGIGVGVFA